MSFTTLEPEETSNLQRNAATTAAAHIATAYSKLALAKRRTRNPDLLYKLDLALREVLDALNQAEIVRNRP